MFDCNHKTHGTSVVKKKKPLVVEKVPFKQIIAADTSRSSMDEGYGVDATPVQVQI